MTFDSYTRFELAENQLTAAIGLFVSGSDRFSVISLAGAADIILSRLILNQEKANFTKRLLVHEVNNGNPDATLESLGKHINDTLFINQIKHMDDDEDGFIDIEPEECALGAILKALANYVTIAGPQKEIVQAFTAWARLNIDHRKYNINCDPNWKPLSE